MQGPQSPETKINASTAKARIGQTNCPKGQVDRAQRPCWTCGRTGHIGKDCPEKKTRPIKSLTEAPQAMPAFMVDYAEKYNYDKTTNSAKNAPEPSPRPQPLTFGQYIKYPTSFAHRTPFEPLASTDDDDEPNNDDIEIPPPPVNQALPSARSAGRWWKKTPQKARKDCAMGNLCGCDNGNDPHLGRTTINLWPPGGVGAAGVGTDTITSKRHIKRHYHCFRR